MLKCLSRLLWPWGHRSFCIQALLPSVPVASKEKQRKKEKEIEAGHCYEITRRELLAKYLELFNKGYCFLHNQTKPISPSNDSSVSKYADADDVEE